MLGRTLVLAGLTALVLIAPAAAQEPRHVAIYDIQGSGTSSPLDGQTVTTSGVVVADFIDTGSHGFFLQDTEGDGDTATSDGIWIYHQRHEMDPLDVSVGEVYTVTGTVGEYFALTEINLDAWEHQGSADAPEPETLNPPADVSAAAAYLEAREGMAVRLPESRVVGATNRFGDSYVIATDAGAHRVHRTAPDGRRMGLMFPVGWQRLDHGDVLDGIAGALTYNYENYKVMVRPDAPLTVTPSGLEASSARPSGPDELTLVTYNLENLFDTIDDEGKNDGEWTPSPEQYARNLAVRARSIAGNLGLPDVVGVQEVESLRALEDLAAHELLSGADYGAALIEGPDGRGIDVGVLYNRQRLRLLSAEQAQACSNLPATEGLNIECEMPDGTPGHILFGRPPIVARLEAVATGGRLNVIVNHFKSKRGGDEVTQPVRSAMSAHNLELMRSLKAAEANVPVIIMGDLNDFEDTPPLDVFADSGLTRDLHALVPPEEDYTYIFNGVSQNLDYILVEPGLEVLEFAPMHINADFGAVHEAEIGPDTQRASDHDPLLLRIPLPGGGPPRPTIYLPTVLNRFPSNTGGEGPTQTPEAQTTPKPTDAPTSTMPAPTAQPTTTVPPTAAPPTATPEGGPPPRLPLRIDTVFENGAINPAEPDEYVEFTNVSEDEVDLTAWRLISVRGDQIFDFPNEFTMDPGQTCRVYTDQDHPDHCGLRWGSGQAVWRNSGDKAELRDPTGTLIDWFCYGDYIGMCR